jgi:hypothetical protein
MIFGISNFKELILYLTIAFDVSKLFQSQQNYDNKLR